MSVGPCVCKEEGRWDFGFDLQGWIRRTRPRSRVCMCGPVDDPHFAEWLHVNRQRILCKLDQLIDAFLFISAWNKRFSLEFIELSGDLPCPLRLYIPFPIGFGGRKECDYFVDRSCRSTFPASVAELDQILVGFAVQMPSPLLQIVRLFSESYETCEGQQTRLIDWFLPEFEPLIDLAAREKLKQNPTALSARLS